MLFSAAVVVAAGGRGGGRDTLSQLYRFEFSLTQSQRARGGVHLLLETGTGGSVQNYKHTATHRNTTHHPHE